MKHIASKSTEPLKKRFTETFNVKEQLEKLQKIHQKLKFLSFSNF